MKTAIATVCLSGGLRSKLEAVAAAEFRAVEIFEPDLVAFPGSPTDIRRICEDLDLKIITYQPFRDFEGMPAERRIRTFDRARRKFDVMNALGCDLMLVCSAVSPDSAGGIDRLAADLSELGGKAAEHGIRIGYEALAWGRHISDYRDAWEIVRRADLGNVGTILDSFHILARGTDLKAISAIPSDRIFLVQIADAPRLDMDLLSWSRHWRCMPFQGDLDLGPFMSALASTGYDGTLSLEIFNDRFRAGSSQVVAVDGHRSLITLRDEIPRPDGRPRLLPKAKVNGIAFVEFAVSQGDRSAFETLLGQLGFVRTGNHRSKEVALFTQGDMSIVVNSDRLGFAHSYGLSHGTSVCALGFDVDNAANVVGRAKGLLYEPHENPIGPGELDLPVFRGVGGSLLYIIDRSTDPAKWSETDFHLTGEKGTGIGLISIDHVSQSMHYEEMLTWLLFYLSLFECAKTPMQEVVDPGGMVQSQVVESGLSASREGRGGQGGVRLVLNGSQSHRTMTSKFVDEFFGSGVQHIAFETRDIVATLDAMTGAGLETLAISDNYYHDLQARFGFSPSETESMQGHNILYDEDQAGCFKHAYTRMIDGGFFFEIVQRDGYRGYGAPNSSIRLAAQANQARPPGVPRR